MKIAWLFPVDQKCGISFYSQEYVNSLMEFVDVESFDIYKCLDDSKSYVTQLNSFDSIHFQYETSFFLNRNNKRYEQFCSQITKPVIVSLHEVYEEFPGVFPRSEIKGKGFLRTLKENIYDVRHPFQTLYNQHVSNNFHADKILVHAHFQKDILIKTGIQNEIIEIIPMPIKEIAHLKPVAEPQDSGKDRTLNLSTLGFINLNYDYQLLFDVLDNLKIPWHFTWIGGTRREEDSSILHKIKKEISKRGWNNKFTITGWVTDEKRNELLAQTDIYLALFSARSSSLSLATALGARRIIIATALPFSQEMAENTPIMCITPSDSQSVIENINRIANNNALQKTYLNAIDQYIRQHSFREMSKRLTEIYEGIAS
jgi:hypothetical protein